MKVAFVSTQLSVNPTDGVAVYCSNIASELRKLGVDVYEIWSEKGFRKRWPVYNLYAFKKISDLVKSKQIDIVHGNNADGFLAPLLDIPFVLTVHTVFPDEVSASGDLVDAVKKLRLDRPVILGMLTLAEVFGAYEADIVIVPSEYTKQRLVKLYGVSPSKVKVIYHGVNIEEFKHIKVQKAEETCDKKQITICFAGKLAKCKGVEYLIKAVETLSKRYPVECRIIGDGPLRARLESHVTTRRLDFVKFLGSLPQSRVIEELARCDIFVMPSLHESLGIAILEAMAAGKPVVATRVGGIPEIVVDNVTGILVPPGNTNALIKALEKLITDDELRTKMSHNARKWVEKFSWKRSAKEHLHIYTKLIT
ncbi:MAG: glycosyltransferase family 4 protein [Desulfurococcaceae archaeon]|uniref:glycosyltransferase family 4 protein n=1 Tax=Thermoprotei TaxID=183924 RepID=UPI00316331FF